MIDMRQVEKQNVLLDQHGNDPILELRNVHAAYQRGISILNDLSIGIQSNRITGIIGPNGAGKSTALKVIFGVLPASSGEIFLRGKSINGLAPFDMVSRGVGYVPQNRSLFGELSVEDNLRLGCWCFRRDKRRMSNALDEAYSLFPFLKERRSQPAGELSGGQQRFLELARVFLLDPSIVLLDEPTAMIAPRISHQIYEFIGSLPNKNITVILVDQNVRQCANVSDYMYVLELGRNRGEGNREAFRDDKQLREMVAEWLDYEVD
jgi:branched-chain amino acid transport system ATP-binding protein